jgi:hypothetical protein
MARRLDRDRVSGVDFALAGLSASLEILQNACLRSLARVDDPQAAPGMEGS